MVERRQMIGGGLLAGLVGALLPSAAAPAAGGGAAAGAGSAAGAAGGGLDENTPVLRKMLEELVEYHRPTYATAYCPGLQSVRVQQHAYLKAQARYPEYIDVGLGVWEQVYEWHITYQVPVKISRLPDGAYTMPYVLTTLVLKPNSDPGYVSAGYDGR